MDSPGLVATKILWSTLVSLPCQGSFVIVQKAACTLGRQHLGKLLWDFAIKEELLELWEGKVTEALMPLHELGLLVGGRKLDVLGFFGRR